MKTRIVPTLAALFLTLAAAGASATAAAADLTVEIKNVGEKGTVMVALYKPGDKWLGRTALASMAPAKGGAVSVVFKDLPEGEYAASIYVDENNNNKLDTNPIGIPVEPYAFSNDASGNFGPPSFEQAKFAVGKDAKTIVINIR